MTEELNQKYLQVLQIFRSLTEEELYEFICELHVDETRLEHVVEKFWRIHE